MAEEENTGLTAPGNLGDAQAAPVEKEAEPAPKPARRKRAAAKKPGPVVLRRYQAKRFPLHHPYQGRLIPVSGWVEMVPDNWLEVQVKANVIDDLGTG